MRSRLAALVHPSVAADAEVRARHERFIVARLAGGLAALAALPPYLALWGVPSLALTLALGCLALPLAAVALLSRTGRLDWAHAASAAAFALLVAVVAAGSGGAASPAVIWLAALPVEAVTSGNRRAVVLASLVAALSACGLAAADALALLPAGNAWPVTLAMPFFAVTACACAAVYGLAACRDEARRRAAVAARDSRDRILLDTIDDMVTWHDAAGTVLFASPAAERLLGVPGRQLHGRGLFDRVHVGDRPAYLKALTDAAHGSGAVTVQLRVHVASGPGSLAPAQVSWVELRARRVAGAAPAEPAAVVAVTRDITQHKAHEAALEAARAEAERLGAAKGSFLATVSHELRTPLNAIIGFSEMLASDRLAPRDEARRREYAQIVHGSGQHLLELVNTLLDISRIESGNLQIEPEAFDAAGLARSCCDLMQIRADQVGVTIVREIDEAPAELVADRRACRQILLNLLSNAVKFTPAGGRVSVGLRRTREAVVLSVSDTGIGIAEADLPRIGDPFFQARASYDRPYEGAGLGLSVVRGLVGLHHGTLRIASAPGEGTSVTVRLPLDCRSAPTVQPARPAAEAPACVAVPLAARSPLAEGAVRAAAEAVPAEQVPAGRRREWGIEREVVKKRA